jgi:hypothetical protein
LTTWTTIFRYEIVTFGLGPIAAVRPQLTSRQPTQPAPPTRGFFVRCQVRSGLR